MNKIQKIKSKFATIPAVHKILNMPEVKQLISVKGHLMVTKAIKLVQSEFRDVIKSSNKNFTDQKIIDNFIPQLKNRIADITKEKFKPVLNLTGTVLHTNLGRASLPSEAIKSISLIASNPSNLEYNLVTGKRGDRDQHIEEKLCSLIGAEASTVVNNNAAALVLILNSLAKRKEVLVSRGELIEIGGSFRLPDILTSAGCKLREVGTTNRTYINDYEEAFGPRTGLVLKAYTSNYKINGFTAEVKEKDIIEFTTRSNIPFIIDLGSGSLIDLRKLNLPKERSPAQVLSKGVDLITFSGDKLLGGPQCGIIAGRKDLISIIKKNPLSRAFRCDKMTIAAFTALLKIYEEPERAINEIPTLRLLKRTQKEIHEIAERVYPEVKSHLSKIAIVEITKCKSKVGSGSLPVEILLSAGLKILPKIKMRKSGIFLNDLSLELRKLPVPIISRIQDGAILLDLRCLEDEKLFLKQIKKLNVQGFKKE